MTLPQSSFSNALIGPMAAPSASFARHLLVWWFTAIRCVLKNQSPTLKKGRSTWIQISTTSEVSSNSSHQQEYLSLFLLLMSVEPFENSKVSVLLCIPTRTITASESAVDCEKFDHFDLTIFCGVVHRFLFRG